MAVAPTITSTRGTSVNAVVPDDRLTHLRNRVSWGSILAGVAAALVVQLLLNILGIGIGASSLDAANTGDNPSASGFSLTAGIWWTLSGIIASFLGGVVVRGDAGHLLPADLGGRRQHRRHVQSAGQHCGRRWQRRGFGRVGHRAKHERRCPAGADTAPGKPERCSECAG